MTHVDPNNPESGTLNIDQAITLEQAVYGYTKDGIGFQGN
jgi:hypothetical protein